MSASAVIREVLERSGLSLRELARRAGTSHATISAYLAGRKTPRSDTLERLARAGGFALDRELRPIIDLEHNARILEQVIDLAEHLPYRPRRRLAFPPFHERVA